MTIRRAVLACLLIGLPPAAMASDVTVKMLTNGPDNPMFVKVKVGDTVTFEPRQKAGHTSILLLVPEGAKPWKAAADTQIKVIRVKTPALPLSVPG
jgi:plastocyanin